MARNGQNRENGSATGHDIVVVGASAGGVEALVRFISGLPADLPAVVLIVVHISADNPGILAKILDRNCSLPVSEASDREPLERGNIYVARPDRHLLVERDVMRVTSGPKENG